jgi:hypothetical protein
MRENEMSVTYTKLKSGEWGLKSTEALRSGSVVSVSKKSGGTKAETVSGKVWSGNGVWLYGVKAKQRTTCRDCGGPIEDAPHHRAMGGLCGSCAFDEYDM